MKLSDFKIESNTERLPLVCNGEDCWIEFSSASSTEFAKAQSAFTRAMAVKAEKGEEILTKTTVMGEEVTEYTETYNKHLAILLGSLIVDWSFDDELTKESGALFLFNNPSIANELDQRASLLASQEAEVKKPQSNQPETK